MSIESLRLKAFQMWQRQQTFDFEFNLAIQNFRNKHFMKYKTITHQHIPNTYGMLVYQDAGEIRDAYAEIQITDTPQLFSLNIGNEIFRDVEGWKDEWQLEEIEALKKHSLPSESIERNVLTDYADWYKSNYGYTPVVTETYIDLFLASATPHTAHCL